MSTEGPRFDIGIDKQVIRGTGLIGPSTITPHKVTSKHCTGMVVSGFLVEVAKVTDDEMAGWRRDHPEAFAREAAYDPATGVSLAGWLMT